MGCEADVKVSKVTATFEHSGPKLRLSLDIGLDKIEFTKILEKIA